jgi:hypothetical protein
MLRQLRLTLAGLLPLLACASASPAQTVWQGTVDYGFFNELNWIDTATNAPPPNNTMNPTTAVNRAMVVNSGTLGGSGAASTLYIGSSGSLTVNGGTVRFATAPDFSFGAFYISNAGDVDAAGQPPVNINGGRVIATSVRDVAVTLAGTGILELTGNSSTANNIADPIARTAVVNITSDGAKLRFLRKTPAQVAADHAAEIEIDGGPMVLGTDPAVWEPGDNAVITSISTQDFPTAALVVRQVAPRGLCQAATGECSVTYEADCTGTWTAGANANGSCVVGGVCTPVTSTADCAAMGGTYTLSGTCAGALFQPNDPGFENALIPTDTSVHPNAPSQLDPNDFFSNITTWWDGDDSFSKVIYEASANGNATTASKLPDTPDGTKWGVCANQGIYNRIGNYDPAQSYTINMIVGDRTDTAFGTLVVSIYSGNFTPEDQTTPAGLFGTLIGTTSLAEAAITWTPATPQGQIASISVNVPNNGLGIPGDILWLRLSGNGSNNANVQLVDAISVVVPGPRTCVADFNGDGDVGTDADIEAFFACLAGTCCSTCGSPDFNGDGDVGTDADIESFFSVLAGGPC